MKGEINRIQWFEMQKMVESLIGSKNESTQDFGRLNERSRMRIPRSEFNMGWLVKSASEIEKAKVKARVES